MAENNSSAPLLPCPFCGASARGYEIEPHQHSAALLALVPNMPKEHQGSYVIEGDCQCGSGLIGDNQTEVTARWNARAPQAVAAQAAPAAVAVPPSAPGLSGDAALAHEQCRAVVHLALAVAEVYTSNALIVASDSRLAEQIGAASAEVMEYLGDTLNSTDATTEEDEWLDPIFEAAQERWPVAQQTVCDSVHIANSSKAANPSTEDSSAGDLAEPGMNYTEAYAGAREDLSIWKRRSLEAERDLRAERKTTSRLAAEFNAANGPTHLGEAARKAEEQIDPLDEHGIAPCPLCGSKSKHVKSGESDGHRILCWSDTCECSSGYFFDKEAAISSWNSRAKEGK